jgi:hypothetical protein
MSGQPRPGSELPRFAQKVMATAMTAEKQNGESIKESMRKKPLIQSTGPYVTRRTEFAENGFIITESSTNPEKFDTQFYYSSVWYNVEIISQFTGTSEHLARRSVFMFDAFVNLTKRLLPSCGANDLVCISRTHSDVDGTSNQNKHTVKKIIYLKTSDVILIEISKTRNCSVKIGMRRIFFDHPGMSVVNYLSYFFNYSKMGMKYLEGVREWFVADPSKRNLAFAMGLHNKFGEFSLVRQQEEGIVKEISRMSLTGSFNPWKAYDEALGSELFSLLDVFKIVLEHTRAVLGGVRDQKKPLSYKWTMDSIEEHLQKINKYLSEKYARIRKKMAHVKYVPPGDDTGPSESQAGSKHARQGCCMNCGLRMMPNTYCLPHAYTSSPVPEVHPRQRAQHDAVEDLMQRVSLS